MVCVPLFWFKIPKDFAQAGFNTLTPLALSRFLSFQHEGRLGRDRCWSQKIKLRFGRSQNRGSFFSDRHLAEGTVEIAVHINSMLLASQTTRQKSVRGSWRNFLLQIAPNTDGRRSVLLTSDASSRGLYAFTVSFGATEYLYASGCWFPSLPTCMTWGYDFKFQFKSRSKQMCFSLFFKKNGSFGLFQASIFTRSWWSTTLTSVMPRSRVTWHMASARETTSLTADPPSCTTLQTKAVSSVSSQGR